MEVEEIEVGDVVKFHTKMQYDLYAKRVSKVGSEAVYWRHPDSVNHTLDALEGEVFLNGLIHGPHGVEKVEDPFDEW